MELFIRCPVCGDERALVNYQVFNENGHRYLSNYAGLRAIKCPSVRETVWLRMDSGERVKGPWEQE